MRSIWLLVAVLGCSSDAAHSLGPISGRLEYVFPDGEIDIFDIDHGHRLLQRIALPEATTIRGVAAHAPSHMLYLAAGGGVVKWDLVREQVVWHQMYPPRIDSVCGTPDGTRLYLPNDDNQLLVIDTRDGSVLAQLTSVAGIHNTICTLDGQHVYVGGENAVTMDVVATADNSVARHLGPFGGPVRPFAIDAAERFLFANVDQLLGFEVADAQTGALLYRVSPPGFTFMPRGDLYTPSHGIALSPDGRAIWIVDQQNNMVHVFDVTGLPATAPQPLAHIALQGSLSAPGPAQGREGWLQFTRTGDLVYVGDAGDVIDAHSQTIVTHLDALSNTRKFLEIDFQDGLPVWASPRLSIGGTMP